MHALQVWSATLVHWRVKLPVEHVRPVLHAWQRLELFLKYPARHVHTHTWDGLALSILLVHLTHLRSEVTVQAWMVSSAAHDACVTRADEAHVVHAENPCPSANDTPAVQAVHAWAPEAEKVPARQEAHTEEELAPTAAEYVPAAHDRQAEMELAPRVGEYRPARQAMQVEDAPAPTVPE